MAERFEREDRYDRDGRQYERNERNERNDRNERNERNERSERERGERNERSFERNDRYERGGRNASRDEPEAGADKKAARDNDAYCRELLELQRIDFALVELTLYLDTHPMDMQAVQQLNQLSQKRRQIASEFEMKHGPLLQFGQSYSRFPWQWIETPWPWQV